MTGGPSSTRLEPVLDETPPDIPSGVVVAVEFLSALQALELVTITIILVGESALAVTTPLRRVGRSHIVLIDTQRPL